MRVGGTTPLGKNSKESLTVGQPEAQSTGNLKDRSTIFEGTVLNISTVALQPIEVLGGDLILGLLGEVPSIDGPRRSDYARPGIDKRRK